MNVQEATRGAAGVTGMAFPRVTETPQVPLDFPEKLPPARSG
jgi:hypothetical protein